MTTVERSREMRANGAALWAVVSDPTRLSEWVPTAESARPLDADDVHLEGHSHGHAYSVDSSFHVDQSERRLSWGGSGESDYSGSLQITDGGGATQVSVRVSVPDGRVPANAETQAELERGVDEALDKLESLA